MKSSAVPLGIVAAVVGILLLFIQPWQTGPARPRPRDTVTVPPPPPPPVWRGPALTKIIYLYDVSMSVHDGSSSSAFNRAIPLLGRAIAAVSGDDGLPRPQVHIVGVIRSLSLDQKPLCAVPIAAPTVFIKSNTGAVEDSIGLCENRLRQLSPEPSTDISGAVTFASLMLQSNAPAAKGIVLFTDLAEDLPAGAQPSAANLRDICVLVFYEATGAVAANPGLLRQRIAGWRHTFGEWGARASLFRLGASFSEFEMAAYLRDCASGGSLDH